MHIEGWRKDENINLQWFDYDLYEDTTIVDGIIV